MWYQYFNGLDVSLTLRTHNGLTLFAGTSTGQSVADNCEARARLPELATSTVGTSAFGPGLLASAVTPLSPYCHVAFGLLTQLRGLSSYVVPKLNLQLSATSRASQARCWRRIMRCRTLQRWPRSDGTCPVTPPRSASIWCRQERCSATGSTRSTCGWRSRSGWAACAPGLRSICTTH